MGKLSRRPSRRNRLEGYPSRDGLTITVGVAPKTRPSGQPSLENELRLLRSALLYADHVDLVAPSAAWMNDFRPLRDVDLSDIWKAVISMPDPILRRLGVQEVSPFKFREGMRKLQARPIGDPDRAEAMRLWQDAIPRLMKQADEVFDSHESTEIDAAIDASVVKLISDGTQFEDPEGLQEAWFCEQILRALANPNSHVLLDEVAAEILRGSKHPGEGLPSVANSRSRHAAVGAGLIEKLPAFPDAPMSQVLEAREELSEGRARYRNSTKRLADMLQSSALDETLPSEIDELWNDDVRPSLVELRRTVSATRVAFESGKSVASEGYRLPTVAVVVANIASFASMVPSELALGATLAQVATIGAAQAFKARATVRKHDLVYLLDVDKRLGKGRG